jgi:DinB superfamily
MNTIESITRGLNQSAEMLKNTVADFTDAELLTRPCPGANHPLWQLGHLCVAETNLVNGVNPGAVPELPAGFAARFENKKTNHIDDPAQLATKQQVMDLFTKIRAATIASLGKLSEADLDAPAPEKFRARLPKVGDVYALNIAHVMMHLGQIQVARRKLNKPILM